MNELEKLVAQEVKARIEAESAEYSQVYESLAAKIKTLSDAKASASKASTQAKEGLWGEFRNALALGMAAGHSANNIRLGLSAAMVNHDVPGGTFRSYVATIASVYEKVQDGTITLEAAQLLKIKEARELVQDAATKALREAREAWGEFVKGKDANEIAALIETLETALADEALEAEAANG